MNCLTDEEWGVAAFALAFGIFTACVSGCGVNEHWKKQAVKHGAATWEVNDDGSTTFKWKGE